MHVLVISASRHGSTHEIAAAIADELRAAGCEADLREVGEVHTLDGYDAVVLGSAVYMGNWLPAARSFVDQHAARLTSLPLWLFSSGPLGAPDPKPAGDPERIADLLEQTHPREHRVFAGKLDRRDLSVAERLTTRLVRAPEGDFRDWEAIRGWARGIAADLGA